MIRGSCCCGGIKFELSAIPTYMGSCHCSRCRKVGASTIVFVKKESFHLLQGSELVSRYEPEPPFKYVRCFCKRCGTALGEIESQEDSFPIAANCLDDDPMIRNMSHEFVGSKPGWYEICDEAPQTQGHPV